MRLNLSFLRIFPISLFFFFLDIKKGLDSLKPLFMRFPSHLIPNFPAKSLFLFFSHFKWLDTLIFVIHLVKHIFKVNNREDCRIETLNIKNKNTGGLRLHRGYF